MGTEKTSLPETLEASPTSYNTKLEQLRSQIQQIITQENCKFLNYSFTNDDLIQFTKTNEFNALGEGTKRLLNLVIYERLSKEFEPENITLSQNLEEYAKRDLIPEPPMGCNSYTELQNSIMYRLLSRNQQERVKKLIRLENNIIIPPNHFPRKQRNIDKKMKVYNDSGLVVMCADDF